MTLFVGILELALTALLLLRMAVIGFLQPPGRVLSWPMFTRGCYIDFVFEVRAADGERRTVDLMSLIPSRRPAVSVPELQRITDFLAGQYTEVSGHGSMRSVDGTHDIRVEAGRVVF